MKRGFTLIEVLAVIVILAIIATITTPIILNTIEDAEKREFKNQVNIVKKNLDYYLIENNKNQYPNCSETKNVSFSDLLLKNVSYFEDGYVCYDTKNEKNYIYARNDKYVAYGTVDDITIKLFKEFDKTEIIHYAYTGIPSRTYNEGARINYAGLDWLVIKDNGNNTTLILKDNYGYGIYGSSVNFVSGNTAYDKVNIDFVNGNTEIKKDIYNNGIIKDSSTNSYVRLPKKDELSTKIANGSNTAFWTMTANGSNLWYGLAEGTVVHNECRKTNPITYYYGYSSGTSNVNSWSLYRTQACESVNNTVSYTQSKAITSIELLHVGQGYGSTSDQPRVASVQKSINKTNPDTYSISSFSGQCTNPKIVNNPENGKYGRFCQYTCQSGNSGTKTYTNPKSKGSFSYCHVAKGSATITYDIPELTLKATGTFSRVGYYFKEAGTSIVYSKDCPSISTVGTTTNSTSATETFTCSRNCSTSMQWDKYYYIPSGSSCSSRYGYVDVDDGYVSSNLGYRPVITVKEVKS